MAAMPQGSPTSKKKGPKGNADVSLSLPSASDDGDRRMSAAARADKIGELIFSSDDQSLGSYLKDLVSAGGLKDAWSLMAKKMRHVEFEHGNLMAFASREALNKDYVTRPEYDAKVELEYSAMFEDHTHRIIGLEKQAVEAANERARLEQKIDTLGELLENEITFLRPELQAAQDDVKRVEEVSDARHAETLQLIQSVETDIADRETTLRNDLALLEARLLAEVHHIEQLGAETKRQKDFLSGPTLQRHIIKSCEATLAEYVHKSELLDEVQKSTLHMVNPLRDEFEELGKDVGVQFDELRTKHAYLEHSQENFERRATRADHVLSERIDTLKKEVDTKAASVRVDNLERDLSFELAETNESLDTLTKDTLQKMQEIATRVTEFQVILEDHEHALQHQAEEILNRCTKYEVAVCGERLDRCALREKVEADIQDLRTTLSWTSTRVEAMAYDNSFGGGGSPTASKKGIRSSKMSMSMRSSKAPSRAGSVLSRSATVPEELAEASQEEQPNEKPLEDKKPNEQPLEEEPAQEGSSNQGPENRLDSKDLTGTVAAVEELEKSNSDERKPEDEEGNDDQAFNGGIGLGAGILEQHELMQAFQEQIQELQSQFEEGPPIGASGLITMIQQQLECVAKVLMGIARACLKPLAPSRSMPCAEGLLGMAREPRMDHCSELLHHVNSVMYWIINSKRPADWVPEQLTTCALRALPPPGADNFASKDTPTKPEGTPKVKRMQRLRPKGAKVCDAAEDLASPPLTGRAFANVGVGWRGRTISATGQFNWKTDKSPKRSSDTETASLNVSLPPATGTRLNVYRQAPETPRVDSGQGNLASGTVSVEKVSSALEKISLEIPSVVSLEVPSVSEEISLPQLPVTSSGSRGSVHLRSTPDGSAHSSVDGGD